MERLAAVAVLAALIAVPAAAEPDGEELFELCVQCHGEAGEGSALALAPSIAGLQEWYVVAQLEKFQSGARGVHPDDVGGLRMHPMTKTLKDQAQLEAVAAYAASLPPQFPEPTLGGGDPVRGKTLYAPCAACHGPNAQGLQPLAAPSLVNTNDWYQLTQLQHFREGIRGTNPADATGMRMRPMALVLVDDQAMKDVIAYVMTLQK